jgi:hypothetical protein
LAQVQALLRPRWRQRGRSSGVGGSAGRLEGRAELLGAPRGLADPALGPLLDAAQVAKLNDLAGEPRLLGLFKALLALLADEHF